jgi:hypothetical protein
MLANDVACADSLLLLGMPAKQEKFARPFFIFKGV